MIHLKENFLITFVFSTILNLMNLKVSEILGKTQKIIFNYPLVLLMAIIMTATAIYLVETDYNNEKAAFIGTKILLLSALGISLSFGLKMLVQRLGKNYFFELICVLFLIGFYFILPSKEEDFTEKYVYLFVPAFVLSHLFVAFGAFLKKENTETKFWDFNKNLFINFFLTLVFTGVLVNGIALAILAVDHLFNMNFDGKIYAETYFFFLILGSSFIFLLFNEGGLKMLEKKGEYPVVLKFFTQFILIPLLLIYVVILYFYSTKILIKWELPRGWVSYLVLAYSLIGILALLLVHPLKEDKAKSWVRMFNKVFYYSLFPLVALLFVAIFTRLLQYGYTEARYFVLLLAIWLTVQVLYFVISRKPTIKFIPVSLFLFGLFSLILPFLNAFSVAKSSQRNQLNQLLIHNDLLVDGKIDFSHQVSDSVVTEIQNKFDFLDERQERKYLESFIKKEDSTVITHNKYQFWVLRPNFKNIIDTVDVANQAKYKTVYSTQNVAAISSYEFVAYNLNPYTAEKINFGNDYLKLSKIKEESFLSINDKDSINLSAFIKSYFDKHPAQSDNAESNDLFFETELGEFYLKIIFSSISRSNKTYFFENATILIRKTSQESD